MHKAQDKWFHVINHVQPIKTKNSSLKSKALLWHLKKKKNNEIAKKPKIFQKKGVAKSKS